MSQSGVGVDLGGEVARLVSVQTTPAGECFILRTTPISEWRSAIGADKSRVTIAIDDRLSNVRIVRPAIIEPSLARDAAEYETRASMLAGDSDLLIEVNHIGNSNDPRAWLAVTTHPHAVATNCSALSGERDAVPTSYLPRSVAMGRGYLYVCEEHVVGRTVLIEPGQFTSAICFLNNRVVIGTAQLRGISSDANDTELAAWFAEMRMVVQYRLSTDLNGTVNSDDANFTWLGDPAQAEKLTTISGGRISPAKLRAIAISPESDAGALTTDWLAALGAALN